MGRTSLRHTARWAALVFSLAAMLGGALPVSANHSPYVIGDVFAGIGDGKINRYSPTGILIEQLDTTSNSNEQTGMCFGESGNLRSTNFSANNMTLFNNMGGVITHPWGGPFNSHPESCVLDATGNIYVGQADGTRDVLKFDPSGALLASYDVATGPRGSDWIDLAADQCTLHYTSEGNDIYRFNVCTNTQLSNFSTNFTSHECYALRIRTNGEVMVACSQSVYRLSPAGVVIQEYPKPATETSFLFALNLDPDNETFWTAGFFTGNIYRIGITSGLVVTTFTAPANPTLAGLAVFGEITAARPPANLTLSPATDTNPVGTQHCVTATVTDSSSQPVEGVLVRFSVTGTAGNAASGSDDTDVNGQATFCYIGPSVPSVDTIRAYADTDGDGIQDAGEPFAIATKIWVAGAPATLVLTPPTATNFVDQQHCVTATVRDALGNPTPGVTVRFTVTGSVNTVGSATTNGAGQATFCYTGPGLPGADTITAYADTDNDNTRDANEPQGIATKTWLIPTNQEGCKVTYGGWITAANGDRANFGGNAKGDGPKGNENYQDKGPATDIHVKSINVLSVTCSTDGTMASIFGKASINGAGSFDYRIDVRDPAAAGSPDTYRIRVSAYDSGEQNLSGGNVQIH